MSDRNTIRILSLDGGGVRGYLSMKFLQKFIKQWGINGSELWKYFDVIAGTSIGGIQALAYAYGRSPEELEPFFKEKAKRIFTIRRVPVGCDADSDSNRPNTLEKLAMIITDDPFYKSACPNNDNPNTYSNYGHNILQKTLEENFGEATLNDLKTKVIVPSFEKDVSKFVIFSNYGDGMFKGNDEKIVDIARATSAAPIYLPHHTFSGHDYIDGGIYQNNPAELALSLGKVIKPQANRFCVMSLGTGSSKLGFDGTESLTSSDKAISVLFELMNIASAGGQESIDFNLKLRSKLGLEQLYYYRFQPKLIDASGNKLKNTELDNSDASFLQSMEDLANRVYTDDSNNIDTFLGHLTA